MVSHLPNKGKLGSGPISEVIVKNVTKRRSYQIDSFILWQEPDHYY